MRAALSLTVFAATATVAYAGVSTYGPLTCRNDPKESIAIVGCSSEKAGPGLLGDHGDAGCFVDASIGGAVYRFKVGGMYRTLEGSQPMTNPVKALEYYQPVGKFTCSLKPELPADVKYEVASCNTNQARQTCTLKLYENGVAHYYRATAGASGARE